MTRFLREPLLHFLVIGALLFGAYSFVNRGAASEESATSIHISVSQIAWLTETWERQWSRPPSEDELQGVIRDYLKEVMLSREAKELGLDNDDLVVRRRLAQKMTFLIEDYSSREPTEPELQTVYAEHADKFMSPASISFEHIYFSPDKRGDQAEADALATLRSIQQGTTTTRELGDPFMLRTVIENQTESVVTSLFGPEFTEHLFASELNSWQGPYPSGYGQHLVYVEATVPRAQLDFNTAREQVTEYWRILDKAKRETEYTAALYQKYEIVWGEGVTPLPDDTALDGGSR
jgi:hypothetical protein